jgi:hypothetical protein
LIAKILYTIISALTNKTYTIVGGTVLLFEVGGVNSNIPNYINEPAIGRGHSTEHGNTV